MHAEAELVPDPDKTIVRRFAKIYNVDETVLVNAGEDRYTVIFRPGEDSREPSNGGIGPDQVGSGPRRVRRVRE